MAIAGVTMLTVLPAAADPRRAPEPTAKQPDAELLLDLDLLREVDVARHRDLWNRMRLLERLRILESWKMLDSETESVPADKGTRR